MANENKIEWFGGPPPHFLPECRCEACCAWYRRQWIEFKAAYADAVAAYELLRTTLGEVERKLDETAYLDRSRKDRDDRDNRNGPNLD